MMRPGLHLLLHRGHAHPAAAEVGGEHDVAAVVSPDRVAAPEQALHDDELALVHDVAGVETGHIVTEQQLNVAAVPTEFLLS